MISTVDCRSEELDAFVKNHVIDWEKHDFFVRDGEHFQVFCFKYSDLSKDSGSSHRNSYNSSDAYKSSKRWDKRKGDDNRDENGNYKLKYPDNITEDQKELFDVLRQERHDFARELNLTGPFILFDNQQLGEMIARKVSTISDIRKIDGIGEGRMKYAPRILVALLRGRGEEIPLELVEQAAVAAAALKKEKESKGGVEKGGKKPAAKQEKQEKQEKAESSSGEEKLESSPVVQGELFSEDAKK